MLKVINIKRRAREDYLVVGCDLTTEKKLQQQGFTQ